jgi:hypothetical protein
LLVDLSAVIDAEFGKKNYSLIKGVVQCRLDTRGEKNLKIGGMPCFYKVNVNKEMNQI